MPFADSAGARVYYDDRGAGEPALLCLPGWCVHHTLFAPTAERLSARHRVLALDWRGHGRSPASEGDWGYPKMVADTLAVIGASGAQMVIPLTQAHAGWIAILKRQRLEIACVPTCIGLRPGDESAFFSISNSGASTPNIKVKP